MMRLAESDGKTGFRYRINLAGYVLLLLGLTLATVQSASSADAKQPLVPSMVAPFLAEDFDDGGVVLDNQAAVRVARMGRALEAHDLAGFLSLHTYPYFREQMSLLLSSANRKDGYAAVRQYSCEFLSICDVSKSYNFIDVTRARLVRLRPTGATEIEVTWRLKMIDGKEFESSFFFDTGLLGFFAAFG